MPVVCMQDVFQVACTCMHAKVFFASYKQSKGILLCNVNNQNEVYLYTVNKDVYSNFCVLCLAFPGSSS